MTSLCVRSCCSVWLLVAVIECSSSHGINEPLHGLERIVAYYYSKQDALNVDGLYGFRIAQGELLAAARIIQHLSQRTDMDVGLVTQRTNLDMGSVAQRVDESIRNIGRISTTAYKELQGTDPQYATQFAELIEKPFIYPDFEQKCLIPLHDGVKKQSDIDHYDEDEGDLCYTKLMGTDRASVNYQLHHQYSCLIDKKCLRLMLDDRSHNYSLTHQLLYFIIARMTGCNMLIDSILLPKMTVAKIQQLLCSKILVENQRLSASLKGVRFKDFDLFTEQALLCSVLGFKNFIVERVIGEILKHQDQTLGCYSMNVQSFYVQKRREKLSPDRCKAHTSGLAVGYMATYIHHWLASLLANQTGSQCVN